MISLHPPPIPTVIILILAIVAACAAQSANSTLTPTAPSTTVTPSPATSTSPPLPSATSSAPFPQTSTAVPPATSPSPPPFPFPPGRFVSCPPSNPSLLEGAEEFFTDDSYAREHLAMTSPPSFSNNPLIIEKSRLNYISLLETRECAWFRVPMNYANVNGSTAGDPSCSGAYCFLNITVYRFSWQKRRFILASDAAFNPPNHSSYPFNAAQVRSREVGGQMFLIDDGPGLDSVAMQSSLIDQFGLVYEPYDFYITNMRGVGSSMDAGRSNLHEVPATTVVDCTTVAFDWRASIANALPRCVTETNTKFGQWMTGISTRGYANDVISVALSLDPVPVAPATPRRLLYGRGYGGLVAEEIQTIMNCNTIYQGKRASLSCSWMNRGRNTAAQEPYCGSSFFIVKDTTLTFDAHIMDGVRDFDRREPALWYQATNYVGHQAFSSCRTCSKLFEKDPYRAALDAVSLLRLGWCPDALRANFTETRLVSIASLISRIGSQPKFSSMASAALPALNAIIFRYLRCAPEDIPFLKSVAEAPLIPDRMLSRRTLFSNLVVFLNVVANDLWSGAMDASVSFDFNVRQSIQASPFRDTFAQETLVYAMAMWPRPRESFFQSLCSNVGVIGCFSQPVLMTHGSLDIRSIPATFVDNFGTLYAVNPKVQSVYQEFVGHVTFYTSSPCVWMYLQMQEAANFSSAVPLPPSCASKLDVDWDGGDDSKFPSNRYWQSLIGDWPLNKLLQLELGSISRMYTYGGATSLFSSIARAQSQAETALLSNSTATLAAELKNFVGSSSAKSAEKLRSINTSTTKLAENVKGLMDASAAASSQEFTSLKNITTTFLDAFHSLIDSSQALAMARLRNLSQSTAFLTKEMAKNTVYTTTAAGASSASLAMAILVMLAIGLVRAGQHMWQKVRTSRLRERQQRALTNMSGAEE